VRTRRPPEGGGERGGEDEVPGAAALPRRHLLVLGLVLGAFTFVIVGLLSWGWGFDELSAAFFIMGALAGLAGRLGVEGTARAFVKGFRDMAYAALLVGFARAIYVVLEDGRIVDTIVHGLFTPVQGLPPALAGLGMMLAHVAVHVPIPSVSGHAVLTMPILVPLSDLLHVSRQVAVLAYQSGAGLTDMITPTNGSLLALLAAGGVSYRDWFPFVASRYAGLLALGGAAVVAGALAGWGG